MDDASLDALVAAAREVRTNAHAPYSGLQVGAAVLADARVSVGVNVENASFPVGVCAERNALAAAVVAAESVGGERAVWSLGELLPSPFERGTS